MLEKTLLNALAAYRSGIRIEGGLHAEEEICHIIEHIDACVEYLCKSYMHHGKAFCPSHRIRESELDARVQQHAEELRNQWQEEQADLLRLQRMWELKRPAIDAHLAELYEEIQRLEEEIDDILMEMIHNGE